ncbi:MAG: hydantoinase/oxoprolinase family protein [Alphaproteobacteria bacterium]
MRVGVEVGGTFTDLVAIDGDRVTISKVPSTPSAPDEGALAAITAAEIALAEVTDLVHGSTVATNAILERKGARIAFVVTQGFRDLLLLQRHNRRQIYDLFYAKPVPVVSRADTIEVPERIDAKGQVATALDAAAAKAAIDAVLARGDYQAVAVCLLNAYANPTHEQALGEMLRADHPDLTVTLSHEVTREFREYERASTTTLAAYVQPVIDRYLGRFETALRGQGFKGRFSMMQSNGGRLPAAGMSRNAITALFSGPAAGVMGAVRQAGQSGYRDLITFDMGGTSTDVCLVADGKPALADETEVDGLPIRTPVLDIVTVGAGGGSIVWVDDGGLLRVGPRSAGAEPGPACYGRGGTEPAITDAHVARGTLRPAAFLGGRMSVDPTAAETALAPVAETLKTTPEGLAADAIRLAESNIVGAIRLVSTARGRDPRDYVLVPFGGAGPLHAARIAEELDIATICVPPNAGVLSAYGLLAADFVQYGTRTRRMTVETDTPDTVREVFAELAVEATTQFAELGLDAPRFDHALAMRYVGQAFEVLVELPDASLPSLTADKLLDLFNEAHARVFEFDDSRVNKAEIVSFRLGAAAPPGAVPALSEAADADAVEVGEVRIYDDGAWVDAKRLSRRHVAKGAAGPALIEDVTSTVYLPAGWRAAIDDCDNLILTRT